MSSNTKKELQNNLSHFGRQGLIMVSLSAWFYFWSNLKNNSPLETWCFVYCFYTNCPPDWIHVIFSFHAASKRKVFTELKYPPSQAVFLAFVYCCASSSSFSQTAIGNKIMTAASVEWHNMLTVIETWTKSNFSVPIQAVCRSHTSAYDFEPLIHRVQNSKKMPSNAQNN